jgi:hypothetical protein
VITSPLEILPMNWQKYTKSAKGIPAERMENFPLKNFPVNTRKKEKIKPKSIAISMGNFRVQYFANIIDIIEE